MSILNCSLQICPSSEFMLCSLSTELLIDWANRLRTANMAVCWEAAALSTSCFTPEAITPTTTAGRVLAARDGAGHMWRNTSKSWRTIS